MTTSRQLPFHNMDTTSSVFVLFNINPFLFLPLLVGINVPVAVDISVSPSDLSTPRCQVMCAIRALFRQ